MNFELLKALESCYDTMHPAVEKTDQAFAWFPGIPHPLFNSVMHLSCEDAEAKVDALIARVPPGNPISFWVHPENHTEGLVDTLKDRGFVPLVTCPLMHWVVRPIDSVPQDIRSADKTILDFYLLTNTIFHFDKTIGQKYTDLLAKFDSENYLLFIDNRPIAVGMLFSNGDIGGIFNVGVLPEHQKQGYGRAMMQFLMKRAHALHLRQLVLLSSPVAEKLYSSLGFVKVFDIEIYGQLP